MPSITDRANAILRRIGKSKWKKAEPLVESKRLKEARLSLASTKIQLQRPARAKDKASMKRWRAAGIKVPMLLSEKVALKKMAEKGARMLRSLGIKERRNERRLRALEILDTTKRMKLKRAKAGKVTPPLSVKEKFFEVYDSPPLLLSTEERRKGRRIWK